MDRQEIIMEMRKNSRFPQVAWRMVAWALTEKYCETFGETLETIKNYFINMYGNDAQQKMAECNLYTAKDIKDILSMMGEQGLIEFDTLSDSPNVKLWD